MEVRAARAWVVHVEEGKFIALSWRDPYLGCTVPWLRDLVFTDPATGQETRGWFRNPCHAQTYNLKGECVGGPCVRGLDRYEVRIDGGHVLIDTSKLIEGPPVGR